MQVSQQPGDQLREGDMLVVWRLDRLGRSLRNLLDLVAQLEEKKVGFRSPKNRWTRLPLAES